MKLLFWNSQPTAVSIFYPVQNDSDVTWNEHEKTSVQQFHIDES